MLIDILAQGLGEPVYTNRESEYRFDCPHCGETKHRLYVSTSKGLYNCYNCGEFSGPIVGLIAYIQGISYKEAFELYKEYANVYTLSGDIREAILEKLKVFDIDKYMLKSPIPLPETFTLLDKSDSREAKRIRKVLHSRLVTDSQITRHKFGYCFDGEYSERAVLPIYEQKELQFWVARATTKTAYKKEMSPTNEEYQISKSEVIFNLDYAAKNFGAIVICEGIYDAVSYGDIGVATLGKILSEAQVEKILKYKNKLVNGVYMSYDEDAIKYNLRAAEELSKYLDVHMINVKDDPNEMGRLGCLEAFKKAEAFDFSYKLKMKLKGY
jgi:DNA primase